LLLCRAQTGAMTRGSARQIALNLGFLRMSGYGSELRGMAEMICNAGGGKLCRRISGLRGFLQKGP